LGSLSRPAKDNDGSRRLGSNILASFCLHAIMSRCSMGIQPRGWLSLHGRERISYADIHIQQSIHKHCNSLRKFRGRVKEIMCRTFISYEMERYPK
jgi:hypothetical protein